MYIKCRTLRQSVTSSIMLLPRVLVATRQNALKTLSVAATPTMPMIDRPEAVLDYDTVQRWVQDCAKEQTRTELRTAASRDYIRSVVREFAEDLRRSQPAPDSVFKDYNRLKALVDGRILKMMPKQIETQVAAVMRNEASLRPIFEQHQQTLQEQVAEYKREVIVARDNAVYDAKNEIKRHVKVRCDELANNPACEPLVEAVAKRVSDRSWGRVLVAAIISPLIVFSAGYLGARLGVIPAGSNSGKKRAKL